MSKRKTPRSTNRPFRKLIAESLEDRSMMSVSGTFDPSTGVFSVVGDPADNGIAVEISSGYITVWNNNVLIVGKSQVPLGQVKRLDVGARAGNDIVNVVQKAEWLNGQVNVYGDEGNDTLTVDVRTDGAAKYAVLGQAGTDRVVIPNRLPASLTTPDETPQLGSLARAQRELRDSTIHKEMLRYDDIVALSSNMVTSSQGSRNSTTYANAIDQFDVKYGFTNRYGPANGLTFCNFFANDVMTAMGVQLPTYTYTDSAGKKHTKSQSANDIATWLADKNGGQSQTAGWVEAPKTSDGNLAALLAAVRAGKPAVAVYKNSSGPGHIAVIRPDQDPAFVLTSNTIGNLIIAQAGGSNFSRGTLWDGFTTSDSKNNVRFFYHP